MTAFTLRSNLSSAAWQFGEREFRNTTRSGKDMNIVVC